MSTAIRGALKDQAAFRRPDDPALPGVIESPDHARTNAGDPIYDPAHVYYLGISLGHILGGVEAALNPHFERIVLNVGGAGFTHMMYRALPFTDFLKVIELRIPDALDRQKYIATLQRHLDRSDPAAYAHRVLRDKLSGSPPDRQVLLQTGIGDAQVPNVAAFFHARLLGLKATAPSPLEVWGVPTAEPPITGSGVTIYDFGLDTSFSRTAAPPAADNMVHGGVRQLGSAIAQMDDFLRPGGVIIHPCEGPCDPE